jgi:hypothetical protein
MRSETLSAVGVVCADCGRAFYVAPKDHWKTVCRYCFKHEMRASDRVRELEFDNARLRAELQRNDSHAHGIDRARWRQLMQLVHPDRHHGSKSANEATQWLLSIRESVNA